MKEGRGDMTRFSWAPVLVVLVGSALGVIAWYSSARAAEPKPTIDPKILTYKLPDQIPWVKSRTSETAILAGDPAKPGIYVMLVKWLPHNMSRPHFHPNDRYITVISGTWWIGAGTKYDPDSTKPMQPGSFVTHLAGQPHYDGAKDTETVIEIVGMGPETSTNAEAK